MEMTEALKRLRPRGEFRVIAMSEDIADGASNCSRSSITSRREMKGHLEDIDLAIDIAIDIVTKEIFEANLQMPRKPFPHLRESSIHFVVSHYEQVKKHTRFPVSTSTLACHANF